MGKILMFTGLLYLLYYTANIVFDLFIKKPAVPKDEDEGEIISMETIEDTSLEIIQINSEEVENLNLPSSYNYSEEELVFGETDFDYNQDRFKEEEEIENFQSDIEEPSDKEDNVQKSFLLKLSSVISNKDLELSLEKGEIIPTKISDEMFMNFFEKASRHIVTGNESGQNFYKSSLVF